MAFDQTLTTQAKASALAYLAEGTLKMALYTANADLNADTLVYTPTNEVPSVGTGYTAGGQVLTGVTVQKSGTTAYLDFNDVTWNPAAFTARGALIYNTNLGNLAVAVLDFGSDKTATTTFTVQTPANTATSALIRFS